MAGDKVKIRTTSWYLSSNTNGSPEYIAADLISVLSEGIAANTGGKILSTQLISNTNFVNQLESFLTTQSGYFEETERPKASLNWILLDEQFKIVASSSGFDLVGEEQELKEHIQEPIMNKNGYLFVYVSNYTDDMPVYFDNLQVTHIRGPILEETNYYPFGLTMTGISSKALAFGGPENKKNKFQNQEYVDDLGINGYEFKYRMHDPQIGRFWQIDPLANKYVYNSTYAFSENKVVANVELEGLEQLSIQDLWHSAGFTQGISTEEFLSDLGHEALKPDGAETAIKQAVHWPGTSSISMHPIVPNPTVPWISTPSGWWNSASPAPWETK
jgi:RHS repeat-associated protein